MIKTGIYGGTFSPIHLGHVAAALAFKEQASLDELLIIPTFLPPHKMLKGDANAQDRYNMCRLAFRNFGDCGISVSDMEIKRGGNSYTYYTVKELSAPERELYLLCGTDMLLTFDEWFRFEDILSLVTLAYIRRENDCSLDQRIEQTKQGLINNFRARIIEIRVGNDTARSLGLKTDDNRPANINISSTDIRKMVAAGTDISAYVMPEVADYIKEKRLYLK